MIESTVIREKVDDTVLKRLKDTNVIKAIRKSAGNRFSIWLPNDLVTDGNGGVITARKYLGLGRREIAIEVDDWRNPAYTYHRAVFAMVKVCSSLEWAKKVSKKLPVTAILGK